MLFSVDSAKVAEMNKYKVRVWPWLVFAASWQPFFSFATFSQEILAQLFFSQYALAALARVRTSTNIQITFR